MMFFSICDTGSPEEGWVKYGDVSFQPAPLNCSPDPPAELISRVNRLLAGAGYIISDTNHLGIFIRPKIVSQTPGGKAVLSPFLHKKRNWVTGSCFPQKVCCKINNC